MPKLLLLEWNSIPMIKMGRKGKDHGIQVDHWIT
jgi:hypothetical protein